MAAWKTVSLGDVCEMYQPKTITTRDLKVDGKYTVYGANGVIGRYDKYNHAEAELLVTCRGATCGAVNVSAPFSWINGNAMVVKPRHNDLDVRFLEYLFKGALDISTAITGAAQPQITRQSLSPLKFSYPPLPVQKAIVAKLDAAFASIEQAIAAAEKNAENADKLYKNEVDSVFNNLGYELQKLGNNAEISYGYTAKSSSQYDGPHYLRITDIQNNDVNWTDVPRCVISEREFKKFQLETGDIVFARTGATTGKSFLLAEPPPAVFASYLIKVAVNKSVFQPEFINQYFQSASYWTFVNAGISGAAQGGFNASKLSSLPIPVPPLDEQDTAVQRLLDFQSRTKQLAGIYVRKAKAMSKLKQSLLQQAFNGQLVDA
jgi:type I restriction enzyme S subunit